MSIYRELRRGPTRATSNRTMRINTIYMRMDQAMTSRRLGLNGPTIYGKRDRKDKEEDNRGNRRRMRRRRRPHSRDRDFEKDKLSEEEKRRLEEKEKELRDEEEKLTIDEAEVEVIRKKKEVLMVEEQDFHIEENGIEHNTDGFDCVEDDVDPQLVVRRGQEFKLTFTFQRPFEGKIDDIQLVFKLGENPSKSKGTFVKIKLEEGKDTSYKDSRKKDWGARILSKSENDLTVAVYSPPNAVIGEWEFSIRTIKAEKPKKKIYQCVGKDDVIILLNPWCRDDKVYMENEDELKEYIENEHGMVFYGTSGSIGAKPWNYGQFQEKILEISLHLLRKAFDYEITKKMSNPVEIARALSRILNDCDDMGVLSGNWSGNYEGGTAPLKWKGSTPILRQYQDTRAPVKYGQCWVFSHVLTTVSRALGLPCRSVTNFSSAHDTNESMTIDIYVDENGDKIKSADSVWNFHVWNEVWINRPDLDIQMNADGKYNGWHAVDATPQEMSESIYQCGPSPLAAIREGEVHIGYDTKFIFAEVNGEYCNWRMEGGEPVLVSHDSRRVGRNISTKSPTGKPMKWSLWKYDAEDRLDVTNLYKHPEGSVAERESVERALGDTNLTRQIFENVTGVTIQILPVEDPKLGEDFDVTIKIENKADADRKVKVTANARPMTYWGDVIGTRKIASSSFSQVTLKPFESQTFEMKIESERLLAECDAQLALSVLAMGTIDDFDDHEDKVYTSEDITVEGPKLVVKGPGEKVGAGSPTTIDIEFTNPLDRELTNCQLSLEGGAKPLDSEGFTKDHYVYNKKIENIAPKETHRVSVQVKPNTRPKKSKERELEIGITCDQLPEIEGNCAIELH